MPKEPVFWITAGFAILGIASALLAFFRTPRETRYRLAPTLEQRLQACPARHQAVIIKGDKKRALIHTAPYIFVVITLTAFFTWLGSWDNPACARLFDFNGVHVALLIIFYLLPLAMLVLSLSWARAAVKTIKIGYFPPLDAVVFNDVIARKGLLFRAHGLFGLLLPLCMVYLVYLGNDAYSQLSRGMSVGEFVNKIESKCR